MVDHPLIDGLRGLDHADAPFGCVFPAVGRSAPPCRNRGSGRLCHRSRLPLQATLVDEPSAFNEAQAYTEKDSDQERVGESSVLHRQTTKQSKCRIPKNDKSAFFLPIFTLMKTAVLSLGNTG